MRALSLFLIILLLAFFGLGLFVKQISYEFKIDIQAPIEKAYNALASHEFKSIQYPNINAETAKVEDFAEGNTTYLEYDNRSKPKYIKEKVIEIESLKKAVLQTETNISFNETELTFTDKKLITRLHIHETISGKSTLQRAMMFFFQNAIKKNKEKLYSSLKTQIESTPDYNFRPEEQK